jgi:hypothetical protein
LLVEGVPSIILPVSFDTTRSRWTSLPAMHSRQFVKVVVRLDMVVKE